MKKAILFSAIASLGLVAGAAQAAPTLNLALGVAPTTGGTPATAKTSLVGTAGEAINVYVFAQTNTLQDPAGDASLDSGGNGFTDETGLTSAGGVAGFQFNVVNSSTNSVNYNSAGTSTTFAQQAGFGTSVKPTRTADGGGGFNAVNGLFETSPGASSYTNTTLGTSESPSLITSGPFAGYDLIATEKWTLGTTPAGSNTLSLAGVTGGIFYDSNDGNQNFLTGYTNVNTASAIVSVPEPASLSLLGLGAMGLIARRRKA